MIKLLSFGAIILLIAGGVLFFLVKRSEGEKISRDDLIIFFGDSLTAGVGAVLGEDYPSVVAKDIGLTNSINAGISGDTTETALQRLEIDVLSKKPSLVVVFLGGNDFLKRAPTKETTENVDEIVRKISETGSKVILVHIRSNILSDKYLSPAEEIAKKYKAEFVADVLNGILTNPELMSDQIHPNAQGYKILAKRIGAAVRKFL
ncbi:MAG: GDSL-type esterase/lipase family protein [Candidatus Woykebacteria bacterium]